jgi:hypothetical protein
VPATAIFTPAALTGILRLAVIAKAQKVFHDFGERHFAVIDQHGVPPPGSSDGGASVLI